MIAQKIKIQGTVQGVGFRPFVYRIAHEYDLKGWVLNGDNGVEIHVEGKSTNLQQFLHSLESSAPPAAVISEVLVEDVPLEQFASFNIKQSKHQVHPTVRISADLPVCNTCLQELLDQKDLRFAYPYINCTDCGPRYSIILGLPYDRPLTTMKTWSLCPTCDAEYRDPLNRRFHAQPVACPDCGPHYYLKQGNTYTYDEFQAIEKTVNVLNKGQIVALKGLGGYHLACNARAPQAVEALRKRKFRKEKPFALMVKDIETAKEIAAVDARAQSLLESQARPIVLLRGKAKLEGVSPNNNDLGLMLPYTPLHNLLFQKGAPDILVMTSANRASEPIAYQDDEALKQLSGIADAFLIGERPIARRVDDSIARVTPFGATVLRRARGYAPGSVCTLPARKPILALGADLKSSITVVVKGQAFVSQHLGDLDHFQSLTAFKETIDDLSNMYELELTNTIVAYDKHPHFHSSQYSSELPAKRYISIQHHSAHIASVLAERQAFEKRVLGIAFDGTGYGDDNAIWGGEFFVGSLQEGFKRVAHLRYAKLVGGDAAAKYPIQAAAGFIDEVFPHRLLDQIPFKFPKRYKQAVQLLEKDVQTFPTTSVGRLFDTVAALLGYTRENSFEGQAAMWLEHQARQSTTSTVYLFPFQENHLDYHPLLSSIIAERISGKDIKDLARAFHNSLARTIKQAALKLTERHNLDTIVLSGGVFQNMLLLELIKQAFQSTNLEIWTHQHVPPNDGGISLGQAAMACFS